jgi:CubicO group peptidase (beta-lactamase class C family)
MKRVLTILIHTFLLASIVQAQAVIPEHPEVAGNIRLLEVWIQSQMAYRGSPGMSVGVVYDQKLIWARGFGYADVEKKIPATPATLYRMASVTKTFTATALMQLRDAGKLSLDDPIAKHLPWFKIHSSFADAPAVTVRHLLTHTSGLPREAAYPYWTDNQFPTIEQIKETLPNQEAVLAPETQWKYSNLALALGGEIVAAVSGMPYDVYVRTHILEPLGMNSSTVLFSTEIHDRLAVAYGRRMPDGKREARPKTDCKGIAPAGNLSSTVEDLARYVAFQMSDGNVGGRLILKGSTLREMHRVHWLHPDWKHGWGIGFAITRQDDRTIVGHGGWLAGFRTEIAFCPEEKFGVIVLTNTDDGKPELYVKQIFALLAPALKKAGAPTTPVAKADPQWNNFVGTYRDPWADSEIVVMNGQLVMIDPTADDPKESLLKLVPAGKNSFKIVAETFNYGEIGELVTFEVGTDGKAVRMKVGENYMSRLR